MEDNKYGNIKNMDNIKLSRWLALYDGVNIIADAAESNGEIFNNKQLKSQALTDYVNTASTMIYRTMNKQDELVNKLNFLGE